MKKGRLKMLLRNLVIQIIKHLEGNGVFISYGHFLRQIGHLDSLLDIAALTMGGGTCGDLASKC